MSLQPPSKDAKDDVTYNLNATSLAEAEELAVSIGLAASVDYAQVSPSQVNDHANWLPKSPEDWKIYERQGAAIGEAAASREDPDLQSAIKSSIEQLEIDKQKAEDLHGDCPLNGEDMSTEKGESLTVSFLDETPARPSLQDRIHDLSLAVSFNLPILCDPHGDTYVYIDPPTQQPEQDNVTYAQYTERYKTPMLMKKQTLLSCNSPFFDNMFGPTNQFRTLRRRNLVCNLPEHVKYVLDLTPPAEGEDAVYLMTELYCCEGVRKWFLANKRWKVSKSLIAGEDEYMPSTQGSKRFTTNVTTNGAWTDGEGYSPSPGFLNSQGVLLPLPLEYSPVRHRFGIERVLAAMQGLDPQLDSAPKVWTTFAVSKYFNITHSPLTDYIIRWLRASPNSYFLEVNPEISLKIADGLQCHDLCRDVFAILVGEEALATTRRSGDLTLGTKVSVYGRKREDVLEPYQTRIEYASKAFIENVATKFSSLVDHDMSWFEFVPEFSKLRSEGSLSDGAANQSLSVIEKLKAYVRGAIYTLLSTNYENMPDADQALFINDHLFPTIPWKSVWKTLLPRERLLTRSFWEALQVCYLFSGPNNLHIIPGWKMFYPIIDTTYFEASSPNHGLIEITNLQDLESMVAKLNHWSSDNGETIRSGQGPRSVSDSAQPNTSHIDQVGQPSPSVANEVDEKHLFDVEKFFEEATIYLRDFATQMLEPPDSSMRAQSLELRLTNTLVSLTDAEWKFLPLWAGGNDDDSGGVFNDDIPLSHSGFSTAGPNVHTGSSRGSSEATFEASSLNTSTNRSLQTNDGFSDTLPPGKVVSEGRFSTGDDMSMPDGEDLSSDKSIVLVPSVNGSSITLDSDCTIIDPSESENDEGKKEKQANELIGEMEAEESGNASSNGNGKMPDVEEFEDTFDFDDDDFSDTMDGDYDDEEDEDP